MANIKRFRYILVTGTAVAAGALTSCTPPSPAWMAAGCYSNGPDGTTGVAPMDFRYLGPPNTRGNIELPGEPAATGVWNGSFDGTCTGDLIISSSLVQAGNVGAATARCAELGHTGDEAPLNLAAGGYPVPADAWACVLDDDDPLPF